MSRMGEARDTLRDRQLASLSAAAAVALLVSTLGVWLLAMAGSEAFVVPVWAALILLVVVPALAVSDFVSAHRTHERGMSTIGWLVLLAWVLAIVGLGVFLVLLVSAIAQLGAGIGGGL